MSEGQALSLLRPAMNDAPATPAPKKPRRQTYKQLKYIAARSAGMSVTDAAVASGYGRSRRQATKAGSENETKPDIRRAIESSWARKGITPDKWASVLWDSLNADKPQLIGSGEAAQIITTPDHSSRLKAVELSAKLVGALDRQDSPTRKHAHAHLHLLKTADAATLEAISEGRMTPAQAAELAKDKGE